MSPKNLLYRPEHEHDGCGVGFVADIGGHPSHHIVEEAVRAVINLTHRGAVDADAKTGDGAGLITQIPYRLFGRELERLGYRLERPKDLAVGMVFFPREDTAAREQCRRLIEATVDRHGLRRFGWREVPVDPSCLGHKAYSTRPQVEQLLLGRPDPLPEGEYERTLYLIRKEIEGAVAAAEIEGLYLPSFSHRTIVYKGLFVAPQLRAFYRDLQDPAFESALAVFHQRYSTNTFPTWFLAQPFRLLAHNGEINTLQGNRNWMRAREAELSSAVWGERLRGLIPVIQAGGSDSASLDNALELLEMSGRDLLHALMLLIPEAWEHMPRMEPSVRAFYEYHACLSEPWDGPAAVAFSDGTTVGAILDRNGLRPARYCVTRDGLVVMASEVGVLGLPEDQIERKGRLGPGQMIAVDTQRRQLLSNEAIKRQVAMRRPYGSWVQRRLWRLSDHLVSLDGHARIGEYPLLVLQQAFNYTAEELHFVLKPMVVEAKEPVWSMGDDTPLSVLADKPRLLYSYFKQKFAQVTNPPIDPLREQLVMSLDMYLGRRHSLLEEGAVQARLVHISSPLLLDQELESLRSLKPPEFSSVTLPALFEVARGPEGLEQGLRRLCAAASRAIDEGHTILILSDRGVSPALAPIPMLLAMGAVHHHLIREGKRMRASLVAETAEARDVHHIAVLMGYGASALNPYLALATVRDFVARGEVEGLDYEQAQLRYKKAVDNGLLKIISKMGISTLTSYHGAQIFEAIGLQGEVIELCFAGTDSRVEGIGLRELAEAVLQRHQGAFGGAPPSRLPDYGYIRFRREGEYHGFNPRVVKALHQAVRSGDYKAHKSYAALVNEREPMTLRDLLTFKPGTPIPLEEVEPVEEIRKRFETAAMSIGALSPEAHKTLAIAMNRIGAKSNTGEGGEDPQWFKPLPNGDSANSHIKQVASARFGVTPEYLARASELQIKIAQGSKPGEGGQLPGHKVAPHIARIRHAVPGIDLISPPPHHDIYSIEDLSQLIYDLKQVNPRAKVNVKLVAEAGVGTIAAGVAKGYADVIQISGHDGGTGASPLSSIKNAGSPWELGLAETQQVLVMNDLRGRVRLVADGGMKTGRDVVVAAMLGAEEFSFGTAVVVAIGCDMARQCHLNTCPTGVATQREDLRAKFQGTPEMAIQFFTFVAQEVREILASLGFRRLEEIIGRMDLLEPLYPLGQARAATLDLSQILACADPQGSRPRRCMQGRNDRVDTPLDDTILRDAQDALEGKGPVRLCYPVRNVHRAVGTKLAGEIAHRYGDEGLPQGTIECRFLGSAGQSFGAFCAPGMRLILEGEANDYVGKGMGGGEIVVMPPKEATYLSHTNVIMGNTVLYGATGGAFFAAGRAGERFAVRNSGALAVVEGIGDHGCEYMTAGRVVVLGETGRNFGAGMSNGVAYVLDEAGDFPTKYNPEMVGIERVTEPEDEAMLRQMVECHLALTRSRRAEEILARWEHYLPLFWRVAPHASLHSRAREGMERQEVPAIKL